MGCLIKGIPVTLYERALGADGLYTETAAEIPNVVVAPLEGSASTTELYGAGVYQLYIPRGDAHVWEDNRAVFFGRPFRLFGLARHYVESMLPLDWDATVKAVPWDLNTPVSIFAVERDTDEEGFPRESLRNVFGEGVTVPARWLPSHGGEEYTGDRQTVREPAAVLIRYTPGITERMIVQRGGDAALYEIISVVNVEDRDAWLDLRVQRKEAAR